MSTVGLIGLGAGLMYLLDPDKGRRRRALARDKAKSLWRRSEQIAAKTSRDLGNRARGVASETRSLLHGRPPRFEFRRTNWPPAARFLAGASGVAMAIYG